ncbi:MAG: DEAD/DEAH box helicase, partial [Alphaproteobacteria bacterium]
YRMLTLSGDPSEEDEDHYADFLNTLKFLYGEGRGAAVAEELDREFGRYRRTLHALPGALGDAISSKRAIERQLSKALSRTERTSNTEARDAMVREVRLDADIEAEDLRHAAAIARVARALDAPGVVEYWKSAPYLLNFMRGYRLKEKLREETGKVRPQLAAALKAAKPAMLDREAIDAYAPLPAANGRMR